MSVEVQNDNWNSEELQKMSIREEIDGEFSEDEGQIQSPHFDDLEEETSRVSDPESLDYGTWLENVGGLIRSENHVMMNTDEELRSAITQAMFLEVASENLIRKRKRQIDILDECRGEEGDAARQIFDDVRPVLKLKLGPKYEELEYQVETSIAKSREPLQPIPDTSRPPPSMMGSASTTTTTVVLPPMHVPPPMHTTTPFASVPPPRARLQHLVPPPVARNLQPIDFSRLDELEMSKKSTAVGMSMSTSTSSVLKTEPKERGSSEHECAPSLSTTTTKEHPTAHAAAPAAAPSSDRRALLTRGGCSVSTSWRQPHHHLPPPPLLVPIPPPAPFRIHSSMPSLRKLSPGTLGVAEWTTSRSSSSPPPPAPPPQPPQPTTTTTTTSSLSSSSSPPGLVGVNVRGLFVGNIFPNATTSSGVFRRRRAFRSNETMRF